MGRVFRIGTVLMAMLMILSQAPVARGQDDSHETLDLRLKRNFGYSLGAQMQGTFSIQVNGPGDLTKVEFLLDGEVIGEDSQAPFTMEFNTRNYDEGVHSFTAIGTRANGEQLKSQTISRQFVATSSVTILVVGIVLLVIAFRVASYFLAQRSSGSRGRRASYGFLGGAVCPNCGRPYAIHWWSLRLGFGRFDRCPHCGKWNMVSRASVESLATAEEIMGGEQRSDPTTETGREEEARRRRIEQSKYDQ